MTFFAALGLPSIQTLTEAMMATTYANLTESTQALSSARTTDSQTTKRTVIVGRIVSALPVLFLTMDASFKLLVSPEAVESTRALGYSPSILFSLGLLQLACLAVYLVPRTAVLGAILWTGYLGGAVATHVRVDNPLFSHVLFPVYVALLLWGGLWLRDERLRALLPLQKRA